MGDEIKPVLVKWFCAHIFEGWRFPIGEMTPAELVEQLRDDGFLPEDEGEAFKVTLRFEPVSYYTLDWEGLEKLAETRGDPVYFPYGVGEGWGEDDIYECLSEYIAEGYPIGPSGITVAFIEHDKGFEADFCRDANGKVAAVMSAELVWKLLGGAA